MYGLLAEAGRGEDNAALGGQVAHISAAEADLLKQLGGAGSVNPTTGLPEYWAMGFGPAAVASATSATSGSSGSSGPGAMGIGPTAVAQGLAALGLGTGSSAPGSTGTGSGVTSTGQGAVAADGGLGVVASLGEGQGNYGQSMGNSPGLGSGGFGIVTTSEGNPVTTTDGVPVMHGNLSGRVANTAILPSDIANAQFFNQLGDTISPLTSQVPLSLTSALLGFFAQMAQAQTPQNVANTRGALALAGPSMGSPSATFGGPGQGGLLPSQQVATSLVTPQAEEAVAPTSLKTPLPYSPLPTTLV